MAYIGRSFKGALNQKSPTSGLQTAIGSWPFGNQVVEVEDEHRKLHSKPSPPPITIASTVGPLSWKS